MPPFTACAITMSADGPARLGRAAGRAGRDGGQRLAQPLGVPAALRSAVRKVDVLDEESDWPRARASTLTALSVIACSPAVVSAPVALGKNLLPTTPQEPTMKKLNTGAEPAAHADRSGSPSRNGSPIATVPAPRRNARRLMVNGFARRVTAETPPASPSRG